jgi:hypothetical protein
MMEQQVNCDFQIKVSISHMSIIVPFVAKKIYLYPPSHMKSIGSIRVNEKVSNLSISVHTLIRDCACLQYSIVNIDIICCFLFYISGYSTLTLGVCRQSYCFFECFKIQVFSNKTIGICFNIKLGE